MKKVTKYFIGAAVALGIAGGVVANKGGEFCHSDDYMANRGDRMVKKVTKKLDLNESQQFALKALQQNMHDKMSAVRDNKAQSKQAFMGLFGGQFDQDEALTLLQKKADTINQHAPEMIASFANFYDSLNAEQQAKMVKFMQQRGGHRMGFWGKGARHGGEYKDDHEQS